MSKFRCCAAIFVFVVSLSFSAFAQVVPKSVLINTASFYDEKGIVSLVTAEKKLDVEFAKDIKGLQDDNAKLAGIAGEQGDCLAV